MIPKEIGIKIKEDKSQEIYKNISLKNTYPQMIAKLIAEIQVKKEYISNKKEPSTIKEKI
jgi:GMP synthase-like glutamine amidotransferase